MSVEPVTITITLSAAEFAADSDAMARTRAAEELGLEEHQIICTSRRATFTMETYHPPLELDEEGKTIDGPQGIKDPATMTVISEWAPAPLAAPVQKSAPLEWPTIKLGRGSRWMGTVPDEHGDPIEASLISDGEKLVFIDSPEGRAVMAEMTAPGAELNVARFVDDSGL